MEMNLIMLMVLIIGWQQRSAALSILNHHHPHHLLHHRNQYPHNRYHQIEKREILGPPTSSITMENLLAAIPSATLIVKMDIQVFIAIVIIIIIIVLVVIIIVITKRPVD